MKQRRFNKFSAYEFIKEPVTRQYVFGASKPYRYQLLFTGNCNEFGESVIVKGISHADQKKNIPLRWINVNTAENMAN